MIPVETVVRKLVADCEFVILPGFGALLSHQIPARFDKETGIFSPPDKRLAFNESLKLDDGLLANYISRHERISHAEAVAYVRHYVERLRFLLEQNGVAVIKGIGQFGSNSEGKLMFEPDSSSHFNNDWYGFQQFKAATVKSAVVTPTFSSSTIDQPVEVYEEAVPKSGPGIWKWAAAACLVGLVCYFSLFFLAGQSEVKSSLNPFAAMFSKGETVLAPEHAEESKAVANQEVEFILEDSAESISPVGSASADAETSIAPASAIETSVKPVSVSGIRYHVIAGAFKGTKRATILAEEMKQKGFSQVTLLPADERSTKVKVSVGAYETETEAHQAAVKLKPVVGEVGWVFKQK